MKKILRKGGNNSLEDLQQKIMEWSSQFLKKTITSLDDLHNFIDVKNINELRLFLFTNLNSTYDWKNAVMNIVGPEIRGVLGPDLCIQKKINFSIQLPGDESSILGMHSDSWSAETPYQINVWIPLTDCFASNSMFVVEKAKTLEVTKSIVTETFHEVPASIRQDSDFLDMKFGDVLLFNPCLLHGNVLNETNKTRISLHLRFKNLYAPELKTFPDRTTGIFYEVFEISENTKFAMDYIKAANGIVNIAS